MEWSIPMHTFEPAKVRIGPLMNGLKPMTPLGYTDGELRFPSVSLLLPALCVSSYDPTTGRLVLSLRDSGLTRTKLSTLQDMLLQTVRTQHTSWFAGERGRNIEEIRTGFQPILEGDSLHLYCPIGTTKGPAEIPICSKGVWSKGVRASLLVQGARVRVVLRVQGISFHQHPVSGAWTGKFRLQHRILGLFF